jgi:O-antigen/teichoic acid export membrane protein
MKNKTLILIKNFLLFALGNVASRFILFFLVPLYTNYLTTAEYGTAELIFTVTDLLTPFLTISIQNAILRFGLSKRENENNIIVNGIFVWIISTFLTLIITISYKYDFVLFEWRWYVFVLIISRSLSSIIFNCLKVKGMNKFYAFFSIFNTIVLAISNIFFMIILNFGMKGYLLANIVSVSCTNVLLFIISRIGTSLRNSNLDFVLLVKMIKYSLPTIFIHLSWFIINSSDKIMIEFMIGSSALGFYTVATKIPSLINVITNTFSHAWEISSVTEYEATRSTHFYNVVFERFTFLILFVAIFLNSIIKIFMKFYVSKDFFVSWKYIPLLLIAASFGAIVSYYSSLYSAMFKVVNSMFSTITGAIVNIIINLLLIKQIGVWGAIIGTVISYFLVAIIRMMYIEKYIKMCINKKNLFINFSLATIQAIIVSFDWHIYITSILTSTIFLVINKKTVFYLFYTLRRITIFKQGGNK